MFKNVYKHDEMKRAEHMAVRENFGWYLYTHELVVVKGKDATVFLEYMCPKNIGNLAITRGRYTTLLDENGIIRDDTIVFRMSEDCYWISTLYTMKLLPWLAAHKGSYEVEFQNITNQWDMYSIQGPKSKDVMNAICENPVDELKQFNIVDNVLDGVPIKVNKGGFTGEKLGYELYISPDKTQVAIDKLRAIAEKFGGKQVTDIQVMNWTLPTESGFYLMCDLSRANPFEVNMVRGINFDKEFLGREALLKIQEEGPKRKLYGFTVDEEDIFIPARNIGGPGAPVMVDGEEKGRVTKVTYSFLKEKNIGYAIVDADLKPGDKVDLHGFEGVLCELPFI